MTLQRAAFVAAVVLTASQDVSGFGVNPLVQQHQRVAAHQSSTAIKAEPSASEKAAELRKKAEEAKRKAQELKKVAEAKAEAAMEAMKRANEKAAPVAAKAPTPPPSNPDKASSRILGVDASDGAIIPISAESVQFTSGVLGGALALVLGASLPFAVVAAAAANYVSKKENLGEINEFVQAVSKASLNTVNWFAKLDTKYAVLGKLTESLDKSLDDLRNSEGESTETVRKIEAAISKTTKQIQSLADEIDLIEGGKQALGAVGDVLETSIDKAFDANKEYKLTERATGAAKKAIDKVKEGQE